MSGHGGKEPRCNNKALAAAAKKPEAKGHPEELSAERPKKNNGMGYSCAHIKAGPAGGLAR